MLLPNSRWGSAADLTAFGGLGGFEREPIGWSLSFALKLTAHGEIINPRTPIRGEVMKFVRPGVVLASAALAIVAPLSASAAATRACLVSHDSQSTIDARTTPPR